jgi:hypothetical protein
MACRVSGMAFSSGNLMKKRKMRKKSGMVWAEA